MQKKTIVFTGGGSAGHVTPNIAIINELDKSIWNIEYIGSKNGIEKELIQKMNISYHGISSGKLRRYVDFENVKDVFKVMKGFLEARSILKRLKPSLVFSKGGFVSVPVIVAARTLNIPTFIHESDMTPGLANNISKKFASKIFTSFEEAKKFFPANKTKVVGSPIRKEILNGDRQNGIEFLNFNKSKPILLIMGGSLGAKKINAIVRNSLTQLTSRYQIVHICGRGNIEQSLIHIPGYKQFEYIHDELADILSATNIVITRGGSNAIFEFLALKIPMIIIPLTKNQSRGDQILNAQSFEEKGFAFTLEEEKLKTDTLISYLDRIEIKRNKIILLMESNKKQNALDILVEHINSFQFK